MIKLFLLSFILIYPTLSTFSQNRQTIDFIQPKNSYITVGYIKSQLYKKGEEDALNSRYGISISAGYTHFLNKKPKLNSLYFGLDWTYLYGSFKQYQMQIQDYIDPATKETFSYPNELEETIEVDQSSIGMQFGASVTSVPIKELQMSLYYRYAPTLSFLEAAIDPYNPPNESRVAAYEESVDYSYAGYNFIGFSVSYKVYMVSIEYKWASMIHRVKTSSGSQEVDFGTDGFWFNIGVRLGKKQKKELEANLLYYM